MDIMVVDDRTLERGDMRWLANPANFPIGEQISVINLDSKAPRGTMKLHAL